VPDISGQQGFILLSILLLSNRSIIMAPLHSKTVLAGASQLTAGPQSPASDPLLTSYQPMVRQGGRSTNAINREKQLKREAGKKCTNSTCFFKLFSNQDITTPETLA
jgi:hypothetical protein